MNPSKTKFRITSITKMITALTLMKLQELDSLNLDNNPKFYLDSLPKKGASFKIRQLAGHLSGLKRNPSMERWDSFNKYTKRDFYEVFNNDNLDFTSGSNYQYSNYGFKLLGLVIEKKCGKNIIECQEEYVLNPLSMDQTSIDNGKRNPDIANFYYNKEGKIENAPDMDCKFKYAQGCHFSTSEDLLKLGNTFLYPSKIFKSYRFIEMMTKQQSLFSGAKTGYGIGIMSKFDVNGNYFWGHNGMENGARSILRIYPKNRLVISILVNIQDVTLDDFISNLAYIYLKK